MSDELNCQLSAFVDDELTPEESELLVRRLCRDESLRNTAACYAIIGDALRGETAVTAPGDFANRVIMAVAGQSTPAALPQKERTSRSTTNWGMVIAASVVLAAVALLTLPTRSPEQPAVVVADNAATNPESESPTITSPVAAPVVALMPQVAGVAPASFDVPVVMQVDRQSVANRARLNRYLLRHVNSTSASTQGMATFRNVGLVDQRE